MCKRIRILLLAIIIICASIPMSYAVSDIGVVVNKEVLQVGEELQVSINLSDVDVAGFTFNIFFDRDKLEYIGGPENSNNIDDQIIYTWVSETGENVQSVEAETFFFRTKNTGTASIIVTGEFYNSQGVEVDIDDKKVEVSIEKTEDLIQTQPEDFNSEGTKNSTNLKSLRINEEGISPDFSPEIKEYYFIAGKEISSFDVTAIPENKNAVVTITGNKGFKIGKNTVDIKVESEDKVKSSVYKIYVTRTENIEKANANLENLAVRQANLNPAFDSNMTQYDIWFGNDVNKLDILAVPQSLSAKVSIIGNDSLSVGHNTIEIVVTAEDGITEKKYVIDAYRRSEQEDAKYEEQQRVEAERLSAVLEESNNENNATEQGENAELQSIKEQESKRNKSIIAWVIVGFFAIIFIGVWIYKRISSTNGKNL